MEITCPDCKSRDYEFRDSGFAVGHDHWQWIHCNDCGRNFAYEYRNHHCPATRGEFCPAHPSAATQTATC